MPIDTREKRVSAVSVTLPWRGALPVGDGTIDQGDRQQAGLMYRGILAGAAAAQSNRLRLLLLLGVGE